MIGSVEGKSKKRANQGMGTSSTGSQTRSKTSSWRRKNGKETKQNNQGQKPISPEEEEVTSSKRNALHEATQSSKIMKHVNPEVVPNEELPKQVWV